MIGLGGMDGGAQVGPQLYQRLRDMILRGTLPPGSRMSEVEIAQLSGTSRQPVREAFIKLAEQGLAEIRPQRGTFVTRISATAVLSARFVRESVEADIVAVLAEAVGEGAQVDLAPLFAALQDQHQAADAGDAARFVALDDDFHRLLADLAGKAPVWAILDDLKSQMNRVRHFSTRVSDLARLTEQHRAVVDGIAAGDAPAATRAMRRHLRRILDDLPDLTAAHPDYFTD